MKPRTPASAGQFCEQLVYSIHYEVIRFRSDLQPGSNNMTRHVVISSLLIAGSIAWSLPAHSQQMIAPKVPHPIVLQQVAPDLYFLDDYDFSERWVPRHR